MGRLASSRAGMSTGDDGADNYRLHRLQATGGQVKGALDIFQFILDASRRGERTVLITITGVIGTSSRSAGTHLAISESGASCGSISGGCVEAALVGLGQRAIASNAPQRIRLGAGSPYIDIRLPCGGGLDLQIIPDPDIDVMARACERLEQRQSVTLALNPDGRIWIEQNTGPVGWCAGSFHVRHDPDLRLVIVGRGAETQALTKLAIAYGAMVEVLSPDQETIHACVRHGAVAWHLARPSRSPHLRSDGHTAIVMLFHDHDWEIELLAQALTLRPFFIGAMGSRQTHERRLAELRKHGVPDELSRRIVAPVGMIRSARDPDTLALSILSQVVDAHRETSAISCEAKPVHHLEALGFPHYRLA